MLRARVGQPKGAAVGTEMEEGLWVVGEDEAAEDEPVDEPPADGEVESLRDAFVEGFNARDLDAVFAVVASDVECPDLHGSGAEQLAEELLAIWERSPGAILTRGLLDGVPCAVAWLPGEEGGWVRAALVCMDAEDGLLSLVEIPDDADGLDRVEADDPRGEEPEEGVAWIEWEMGEEAPGTAPR